MRSPKVRYLFVRLAAMSCAAAIAGGSATVSAPGVDQLESMEMRGAIGPYRIGLNYTVRQHTMLVTAHYFYDSQLRDIPLKGVVHGEDVTLTGDDGSTFRLHFVGNGSNGKDPLTFYNSLGLAGSWTLGSRTLPVNLQQQHSTENPETRLYAQVTNQLDAVFEAMVAATRQAILNRNEGELARHVQFPLRVNEPRLLLIHNAAELKAHWQQVFTPDFLAKLRADVTHEMFVHNGEAMLGDGELWFSDKGLVSINAVQVSQPSNNK